MLEGLIREIEEYGKYKGVLVVNKNGCDHYISVSDIKKIIRKHIGKRMSVDAYLKGVRK